MPGAEAACLLTSLAVFLIGAVAGAFAFLFSADDPTKEAGPRG